MVQLVVELVLSGQCHALLRSLPPRLLGIHRDVSTVNFVNVSVLIFGDTVSNLPILIPLGK